MSQLPWVLNVMKKSPHVPFDGEFPRYFPRSCIYSPIVSMYFPTGWGPQSKSREPLVNRKVAELTLVYGRYVTN